MERDDLKNNGWTRTEDVFPPNTGFLVGFKKSWIDEDFNPDGTRDIIVAGTTLEEGVWSFKWDDEADEFDKVEGDLPTHWRYKKMFDKPTY